MNRPSGDRATRVGSVGNPTLATQHDSPERSYHEHDYTIAVAASKLLVACDHTERTRAAPSMGQETDVHRRCVHYH